MSDKNENVSEAVVVNSKDLPRTTLPMDTKSLLASLANKNNRIELTSTYLSGQTMEEGEEKRFVFIGVTEIPSIEKKDVMVDAVRLLSEDGVTYINAGAVIVGSCRPLIQGDAIAITYKGKAKAKNSAYTYDDFKVDFLS